MPPFWEYLNVKWWCLLSKLCLMSWVCSGSLRRIIFLLLGLLPKNKSGCFWLTPQNFKWESGSLETNTTNYRYHRWCNAMTCFLHLVAACARVIEHGLKVCLREKFTHLPFIEFLLYYLSPSEGIQLYIYMEHIWQIFGPRQIIWLLYWVNFLFC